MPHTTHSTHSSHHTFLTCTVGTQDSSHIPPRRKFVYHVRQNYRHATIVALPKRSAGCCHNYQCGSSRAAVWISCLIIMFSGSMDPCRDDPRVACTGAISPRLKRHVGCCHTTNVTPHEQPLFQNSCRKAFFSPVIHHSPEKSPGYTKPDFHFQDKRSFARDRSCGRGSRL